MQRLMTTAIAVVAALLAHHATAADDKMTIAVFTKNSTNPAYEAFRIAADQIARTTGAMVVHFVPKQPDNVDEQKAMVEQVIKNRPDAIIFIPVDDVAMVPSVKLLNEAKIPVILVSNPLPGSFVTYVGADDFEIGYREARYLFEHLGAKGKIVVIEGTPAAPTNRERLRGYQRAFGEFPGIEVLGSAVGNYQTPDARRGMEKLLAEHKQIDAVLSANDSMALGVLDARQDRQPDGCCDRHQRHPPGGEADRSRRDARERRLQHVQDRLHRDAGGGASSQARTAAGEGDAAGRGDRQDQLQGLAGAGRSARLPGMERGRALIADRF
ncbi:sugar ABC transporter substrate-binding protein [Bradyrhizobium sp. JYMT SZCCT0428]|uniref:sugar ABC transporter substrate-binding protein n=1 Tax=Bradyrhizobium sp. JYMT SZCCT0428 TaxID=2807673 RepID=UPI001BA9B0A9|nr:sugar ABC transporter substrate-binding protein [Bradyrhizobium sp. JYMT SZCCT0428]MBR1153432.1 sugar ABC transporter substrate-binding protein [Bradyrhizobium sp. JYMT SZCCT0428]